MSQEDVEALKRGIDAFNRRDLRALLKELDPNIEWHSALPVLLAGERTVYRGHKGVRDMIRESDEVSDYQVELSEIRDLGDQLLGIGHARTRGARSGIELDSPWFALVELNENRAIRIRTYLDRTKALEAAGLRE
jgi:ketosteroid isomerase-like protein